MGRTEAHPRHRRAGAAAASGALGSDGLTNGERQAFLLQFRRGPGSKPAGDGEWQDRAQIIIDKLADSARRPGLGD